MTPRPDRTAGPAHRSPARTAGRKHRAPLGVNEKVRTPRRTLIFLCGLLVLVLGIPAAIAATGGFPSLDPDKSSRAERGRNLVFNGDFEKGLLGWRTNHQSRQLLSTSFDAVSGKAAATLSRSTKGKVAVNDATNTVLSAKAGRTYVGTAFVRARGGNIDGKIRIREFVGQQKVARGATRFTATTSTWTKVPFTYVAERNDSQLDLNVLGSRITPGMSLMVDNISMFAKGTNPIPAPSEPSEPQPSSGPTDAPDPSDTPDPSQAPDSSAPASSTAPPSSSAPPSNTPSTPPASPNPRPKGCVSDPMGIPAVGQTFLGAAVNGTSVLPDRERQLGRPIALRRTYYQAGQIDSAVRTAKSDLAAGRLPWISFKEPLSWSQMASGAGDAWITELADKLKTVPGPVWLAVHHEPEGDGNMDDWTAMQARIAPIIHARTDNVAYSLIYSGWNTYGNNTNTVATKWPGDANVDIMAIDAYNEMGKVNKAGKTIASALEMKTYYAKMAAWSQAHGTAWAIGETGQLKSAAAVDPTWLDRAFNDMVSLGGAGLAYYDSSLNSSDDLTLDDPVKFARFKALQADSARLC